MVYNSRVMYRLAKNGEVIYRPILSISNQNVRQFISTPRKQLPSFAPLREAFVRPSAFDCDASINAL